VPPGLIAGAKMYSLFWQADTLYVICTGNGPASQLDYTKGLRQVRQSRDAIANLATTAVINGYIAKIQAVERTITEAELAAWAVRKGNLAVARADIRSLVAVDKTTYVKLTLVSAAKKISFDCSILDKDVIFELVAAVTGGDRQ
jgi:hypothetical protein